MNRGPLREWVEQTDVDGFDLGYVITPGSLADLVDCVVPVLTARGAYQSAYTPGTLRHKLLGPRRPVVRQHRGAVPGGRSGVDDHRPAVHAAVVPIPAGRAAHPRALTH
jgi:long-chain alkane monooxygenase